MTRPITIVFLACILAIPLLSTGSALLPSRSLAKTLRPLSLEPIARHPARAARKSSPRSKTPRSKAQARDDEPVLVILYDVRPGSWL